MQKKQVIEEGFSTSTIYDSKNTELINEGKYYFITKVEVYYTTEGILGFFPQFDDRAINKKIEKDSCYFQFNSNLKEIKRKLKNKGLELKHEVTYLSEPLSNIKIIYDDNSQEIKSIKFSCQNHVYIYGNFTLFNRKDYTLLMKRNCFVTGMKTTYLRTNDGIPYLSYMRCYFGKFEDYEKFKYHGDEYPCCTKFCNTLYNLFVFPFIAFDFCFCNLIRILIVLLKILFICSLVLGPPGYFYLKSQNIFSGKYTLTPQNTEYELNNNDSIRIYTDDNGFSHIKANSPEDAYFGLGFEHAKNRLWQIDMNRRLARGTLSELFGKKSLETDKFMRSLGINKYSEDAAKYVEDNSEAYTMLKAYLAGVNYYGNNFKLPPEYYMTFNSFKNYTLHDMIATISMFTLTMSHDYSMEVWYQYMKKELGIEFTEKILKFRDIDFPFWNHTIVTDEELVEMGLHKNKNLKKKVKANIKEEIKKNKTEDKFILEENKSNNITKNKTLENVKKENNINSKNKEKKSNKHKEENETNSQFNNEKNEKSKINQKENEKNIKTNSKSNNLNEKDDESTIKQKETLKNININDNINQKNEKIDDTYIGNSFQTVGASNCWNIDGRFTESGKPILCNDPHLPNGMPNIFFISKFYLPNNIISAASIPGTPIFITGANSYISWGVTTENSDNADFCEEIIQGDYFIKDNKNFPLTKTIETINIKGSESIEFEVKYTDNGPIFGKTVPKAFTLLNEDYVNSLPLSLRIAYMKHRFTGFDFYMRIAFSHKPSDFLSYKHLNIMPNYNLHWATKDGEIGWAVVGTVNVKNYYNRFCHGFTSEDDIIKEIPQKELLKKIRPEKGFIVTANNKPASFNYLYELRGHHNNIRAYRIEQMITEFVNKNQKISIKEATKILNDTKDSNAEYILPKILEIVKRNTNQQKLKTYKYYNGLHKWNYEMNSKSREASAYAILERQIGLNLLSKKNKAKDEEIASATLNYLHYWNFISGMIDKIYKGEKVTMKNCEALGSKGNCEKYIVNVFDKLEEYIAPYVDSNGIIKPWGMINFNDFPHTPFDEIPILNKIFSRRNYAGGNRNTIKISRGPVNSKKGEFIATQTPRLKFVCDMKEPESPYLTISGGNGGNPFQKYYNNLADKHELAELIKFENIDFNESKYNSRIITIQKELTKK